MIKTSAVGWGELAPSEHILQVYEREGAFLDSLAGFILDGLRAGEGVITIATPEHRLQLEERLIAEGIDVAEARLRDDYIDVDAAQTLAQFMADGWPDEQKFQTAIADMLSRAGGGERRVRAFGEMVAVLWAAGQTAATVRLEQLWHRLCQQEGLSLLCAYPKSGFSNGSGASLREICTAHSRVLLPSRP